MKDRHLVSNMRSQLHDMRSELIGVRVNLMPGGRTAAIERARSRLLEAMTELNEVLAGPLEGDGAPPASEPRFIGLDTARHTRAGEARK